MPASTAGTFRALRPNLKGTNQMPLQIYAMLAIALIGAVACWHEYGLTASRRVLLGAAMVSGSVCVGFAALMLRSL